MSVLPNPHKSHIDRRRLQRFTHAPRNFTCIAHPIQQMIFPDSHPIDQPLLQILAKASRMRNRQPHILIQVKHLHTPPVNPARPRQRLQKRNLRISSSNNNTRATLSSNRAPYTPRRLFRGRSAERRRILKHS